MRTIALLISVTAVLLVAGCSAQEEGAPASDESAVVTSQCPQVLKIKAGEIHTKTFDEIAHDEGFELSADDKVVLGKAIDRLKQVSSFEEDLRIDTATGAVCTYKGAQSAFARFYTSGGKKILRIDSSAGDTNGFSLYVTVSSTTPSKWTIRSGESAGIVLREADADTAFFPRFIANAEKLSISATP